MSLITAIDGYKTSHIHQYPVNTEYVYSNFTPRTSRIPEIDEVIFFGLQHFLDKYLGDFGQQFFDADVDRVCDAYAKRMNSYLGPDNTVGTDHIRALHALGHLPLRFSALPEGTATPLGVPMFTVENTHPDFGWLVNYFETILSSVLWMPCTSATNSRRIRVLLDSYAELTGSSPEFVDFQGHDFSFRGMPGLEAAQLSGMGHLINFVGTDTIPAIETVESSYPVSDPNYLIGASVAATEHSVMCAGGEESERETFERLLDLYPTGILSVVSDTWNFWDVLTEILPALKDRILARDGKLVIRPDSGDPELILCGDPDAEDERARKGALTLMWEVFGGTLTETGHMLLDSHVGLIYGDGINYERADSILNNMDHQNFASGNVVFGLGSYTYQYVTRDTFGFAMKATSVVINGVEKAIFKKPVTDNGGKTSHKGRLSVVVRDGRLSVMNEASQYDQERSLLTPVWENGRFLVRWSFDEVRANARG